MLDDLRFRLRALFRRASVERDLDDELRFHLERQAEKHMRSGLPGPEAARRARLELAGAEQVKEACRDARGTRWAEELARDLRYAARSLLHSPGFTPLAVLSLALGIGANTSIFQLLDALRLRPLPVRAPGELATVRIADMRAARGNVNRRDAVTYGIWEQIQARQEAFAGIFAWAEGEVNLAPSGEARMANADWVSGEFFPTLGVEPFMGRLFTPSDDRRGCGAPGAVVSYGFWKSELGGDRAAIGRKLVLNGHPVDVVGVTEPGFFGLNVGSAYQIALPICSKPVLNGFDVLEAGTFWWLAVMGRLKPGWTAARATAQLNSISPAVFEASLPPRYPPISIQGYLQMKLSAEPATTGTSDLRQEYSESLALLLAIAGLVLLIACVNLANLMLARGSARAREIAIRLAMGAGRGRLVRQLMAESALIAVAGAGAGLWLARGLSRWLVALLANGDSSVFLNLNPDWRVLLFAAGLAATTCLVFGLAPAFRATAGGPGEALRGAGRGILAGRSGFGMRRALVAVQVALSLVLLVGALLFAGTFRNLMRVDAGFRPDGLLIVNVEYAHGNPDTSHVPELQRRLLERLRAAPGVISAAATNVVPVGGSSWSNAVWMEGADPKSGRGVNWSRISPGYFQTMGTRLKGGRDFDDHDALGAPAVAIVNELFGQKIAGAANPVGMRFHVEATPTMPETAFQIVGVVSNTKYGSLRESPRALFYVPLAQDPRPPSAGPVLMRCAAPAAAALAIRRALAEADPAAGFSLSAYGSLIRDSLLPERLMALLAGAFGILAALLSAIGLYGVVSYITARRKGEIGIRVALGARKSEILAMVLGESFRLIAAGLLIGIAPALVAGSLAGKLLFGVQPYDAATLTAAIVLLGLAGLAASYLPAWRAARLDPMRVLREE